MLNWIFEPHGPLVFRIVELGERGKGGGGVFIHFIRSYLFIETEVTACYTRPLDEHTLVSVKTAIHINISALGPWYVKRL